MITRAQAQAFRQQYIAAFPERVDDAIKSAAINGRTSLTISYVPLTDAAAQNFVTNQLVPAGWTTSAANTTDKTITIAP